MKINGVEVIGNSFAYDGCHKIYIIESEEDMNESMEYGYEIFPIDGLEMAFNNSCGLQFISNWKLNKHYVKQFEENVCFER